MKTTAQARDQLVSARVSSGLKESLQQEAKRRRIPLSTYIADILSDRTPYHFKNPKN